MKQYKRDSVLNRIIEDMRKKQKKKPLKGPGSKMIKQLLRGQLKDSIRKNIDKKRRAATA